jgi:hypothetical protein
MMSVNTANRTLTTLTAIFNLAQRYGPSQGRANVAELGRTKRDGFDLTPAADLLNDRVLPFFEEHEIALSRVLTDRGTEYCGTDAHEYELYLAVEDIDHTRTKIKSPPDQRHL